MTEQPEKSERQRAARTLEAKREEAWRAYDEASRDIDDMDPAVLRRHYEQLCLMAPSH
jgi:hypothetical protein